MIMIHKTANIWGDTKIGEGTKIGAFCDIGDAIIGKNCKIQCHVSIPPGTVIGDYVFIGPGARIANDRVPNLERKDFKPLGALIRDRAVIGMGALIGAGVVVGEDALVGMGAVVIKNVEAKAVVVGNPAKEIGLSIYE